MLFWQTTIALLVSKAMHRTGGSKELELLLNAMEEQDDDLLTEPEYILANLVAMGKVDESEVEIQRDRFLFYNNLVSATRISQSLRPQSSKRTSCTCRIYKLLLSSAVASPASSSHILYFLPFLSVRV
jgi:hypothetical protein